MHEVVMPPPVPTQFQLKVLSAAVLSVQEEVPVTQRFEDGAVEKDPPFAVPQMPGTAGSANRRRALHRPLI